MHRQKTKAQKGFTIIELLVVIVVIGILSGVLVSVVNSSEVRAKARDSQRKTDLEKIKTALELYLADNRNYPVSSISNPGGWERVNDGDSNLTRELGTTSTGTPVYLEPVPEDPAQSGNNTGPCNNPDFYRYNYKTDVNGDTFFLTAIMEVEASAEESPCPVPLIDCGALYDTRGVCYYLENS